MRSKLSLAQFGFNFFTRSGLGSGQRGLWRAAVYLRHAGDLAAGAADGGAAGAGRGDFPDGALSADSCAAPISFLTELLAAIPSVVYGLWAVFVLVPLVRDHAGAVPGEVPGLDGILRAAELRRGHADGEHHPGDHDSADHLFD